MQLTGRENYHYLSGDVRNVARMLLPAEADPILIVFYTEVEFARERSWVKDIRGWSTPAELMKTFLGAMKDLGLKDKKVGFDVHTVPAFLLHKFETLNPKIDLVENEEVTMRLRYYKGRLRAGAHARSRPGRGDRDESRARSDNTGATETHVASRAEGAMRDAGAERFGASTFRGLRAELHVPARRRLHQADGQRRGRHRRRAPGGEPVLVRHGADDRLRRADRRTEKGAGDLRRGTGRSV